jgi:hypothetical protein
MLDFLRRLRDAIRVEAGQDLLEYVLILLLIAIAALSAAGALGCAIVDVFSEIVDMFPQPP